MFLFRSPDQLHRHAQARKPDFDAFIAPQRSEADVVIQVLPTNLIPGDTEGKILRTRMVQKEGLEFFDPAFLFDEGSTISWVPCGRKLTCSFPGIKFAYGPDTYYDNEVSVIEMDGQFDNLQVWYSLRYARVLCSSLLGWKSCVWLMRGFIFVVATVLFCLVCGMLQTQALQFSSVECFLL